MFDSDGAVVSDVYTDHVAEDWEGALLLDGGEGDDEIWHFYDWSNDSGEEA